MGKALRRKSCDHRSSKKSSLLKVIKKSKENDSAIINGILKKTRKSLGLKSESESSDDERIEIQYRALSRRKEPYFVNPETLENLLHKLDRGKPLGEQSEGVKNCLKMLHSNTKVLWNSPSTLLRAIKYSLFTRDWEGLNSLLYQLVHCKKIYRPIVRHVCHIMDDLNPIVEAFGVKGEFKSIQKIKNHFLDEQRLLHMNE